MKRNYEAVLLPSKSGYWFQYKKDAVEFAKKWAKQYKRCVVKTRRTGLITYILLPQQCDCSVCGNELQGRQHCPLCGELHHYW